MKATIQQNNISANVSINIASFVANIQCALRAIKQRVLRGLTLHRLYRKQLRLMYRISDWMEKNSKLTNIFLACLYCVLICRALMCL